MSRNITGYLPLKSSIVISTGYLPWWGVPLCNHESHVARCHDPATAGPVVGEATAATASFALEVSAPWTALVVGRAGGCPPVVKAGANPMGITSF